MAVHAGRLQFGASQSAAGQLEVADDLTPAGLSVQADITHSLYAKAEAA